MSILIIQDFLTKKDFWLFLAAKKGDFSFLAAKKRRVSFLATKKVSKLRRGWGSILLLPKMDLSCRRKLSIIQETVFTALAEIHLVDNFCEFLSPRVIPRLA